ncbi:MAG TPA: molybdenum cofactor guanylyltransferase [Bryobacteraceae bacterium]|jgi:molybdopterin-guanine dinucleotide biosynthesis protein A|nr:molybdenum cofactor guanylyltransferase [Bryobacteraceae bacterium]
MPWSGFVLAGGGSSRMGRDKAMLPYRGTTLVEHLARIVQEAAGAVALIAEPSRYRSLGYPVYPDKFPGCGPLGGVYTALSVSSTDWNLIVACDMPGISAEVLRALLGSASESGKKCVVAIGPAGEPEPLCAVYHRSCLPVLERAMEEKRFKMKDLVAELDATLKLVNASALANVNTPAEWADFEPKPTR